MNEHLAAPFLYALGGPVRIMETGAGPRREA